MRNPNGYGSVVKLKGNRRKPYRVQKTIGFNQKGHPTYDIIGYCETRQEGMLLLAKYNVDPWDTSLENITLTELYTLFKEKKAHKLSINSQKALVTAFNHCAKIHNRIYKDLKPYQMQECIDRCGRGYSTQGKIKSLFYNLDRFALELDISVKKCSDILTTAQAPQETSRKPLSEEELAWLWEKVNEPWVDSVLILLYTGFRIEEFLNINVKDVDLKQGVIRTDGSKTQNGKNRVIPIHSRIMPLVQNRMNQNNELLFGKILYQRYLKRWKKILPNHVPHEARHTLRSRLDSAGANQKCINMIVGHADKSVGLRVYTHKTIDELKAAMELIN